MTSTSLAAALAIATFITPPTPVTPSVPTATADAPLDIPAACDADGTMRIPVSVENAAPRSFVLDTGSSVSFVDAELAAALRLTSAGRIASGRGFAPLATANLSVGDRPLPAMSVVSDDRSSLRGLLGESDAGIIGSDVMRAFGRVTIDYASCRVIVGGEPAPRRGAVRVPLTWHEGRPVVVIAGGGRLLLDSGASVLTVFDGTRAASTFRMAPGAGLVRLRRVSGDVVGRIGLLPQLSLGDLELGNVPALGVKSSYIGDASAPDGLLPLTLFQRVHINTAEAYAILEPKHRR